MWEDPTPPHGLAGDPLSIPYSHCSLCPDFQTLRVIFAVLGKGCFAVTLTTVIVYKSELFPTPLR